jgi:hypothetical protein
MMSTETQYIRRSYRFDAERPLHQRAVRFARRRLARFRCWLTGCGIAVQPHDLRTGGYPWVCPRCEKKP